MLAPIAAADPTPTAAVAELNAWRAEVGEQPVMAAPVAAWDTGCNHADNYNHLNNTVTHSEMSGNSGYTSDGATAAANSVLAEEISEPSATPDSSLLPGPVWDPAVFHRAALLEPRLANTGFDSSTFLVSPGEYASYQCMRSQNDSTNPSESPSVLDNTRTTPGLTLYPSPANGAYGVPTTTPPGEVPDPAKETGVPAGSTLGWLINVEINGPWADGGFGYFVAAHDVTATLTADGTTTTIPVAVSQCGPSGCGGSGGTTDGLYFEGGFGIFPLQPLAANTTYRVVLTGGTVTDFNAHVDYPIPAGYSWCFTTAAHYAPTSDCGAATTASAEPVAGAAIGSPGTGTGTGSTGPTGSSGLSGSSGTGGSSGPTGPTGLTGLTGLTGVTGSAGKLGAGPSAGPGAGPSTGPGARPPRVVRSTLAGLRRARPKLVVELAAGSGSPPLRSVSLTLPHGLTLTRGARVLGDGVSVLGVKSSGRHAHGSRRTLTVTVSKARSSIAVVISPGALTASVGLRAIARSRHPARATLKIVTIDADGHAAQLKTSLAL